MVINDTTAETDIEAHIDADTLKYVCTRLTEVGRPKVQYTRASTRAHTHIVTYPVVIR